MDNKKFLEKNTFKLVFAVGALTLAILLMIPLIISPVFNFIAMSQILGLVLFFLGVAAYYICKMFDKSRSYGEYALLGTGLAVLLFLSVGLAGFKPTADKAQGAAGNAYAYFKESQKKLVDVKETFGESEGMLGKKYDEAIDLALVGIEAGLTNAYSQLGTMRAGVESLYAGLEGLETVAGASSWTAETPRATVIATLTAMNGAGAGMLGLVNQTPAAAATFGAIVVAIETQIGTLEGQIASVEALPALKTSLTELKSKLGDYKGDTLGARLDKAAAAAKTASVALLFTYIACMLAFGLFPLLKGAKKMLIRHCDDEAVAA